MRKPRLLIVDDNLDLVDAERAALEHEGFDTAGASSGEQARSLLEQQFFDLLLLDEQMDGISGTKLLAESRQRYPGIGAIFITGFGDFECAVRALRAGAFDVLRKPVGRQALVAAVRSALEKSQLAREHRYWTHSASTAPVFDEIVGESAGLRAVLETIRKVAPTAAQVLLLGESGVGKDLVARAIHRAGPRSEKPFLVLNSAGIPSELVESTLFGHARGAFTGAVSRSVGHFEAAHTGTLFLDEIGDMTLAAQARLLRVLDTGTVTRVGETAEIPVDVRVIAATNRDLKRRVAENAFREDLYYRISGMPITIPPLRDRKQDIPALATHFLTRQARKLGKPILRITPEALARLIDYHWPGNVRQLKSMIDQAAILTSSDAITPDLLPDLVTAPAPVPAASSEPMSDLAYTEAKLRFEKAYFAGLLEKTKGNKSLAAQMAGMERSAFYDHLKKIDPSTRYD